jgi:hypothetical protein
MASEEQELISAVLLRLATWLKQLSPEEWDAVRGGSLLPLASAIAQTDNPPRSRKKADPSPLVEQLVAGLSNATDRDTAALLLKKNGVTNDILRAVAAALDIPAPAKDRKDVLQQRLVESTIGFRLRSQAIQGTTQL